MIQTYNTKDLLQMQQNQEISVTTGEVVIHEGKEYEVVEVKGKALHIKQKAYPFDSFLVSKELISKV